MNGIEKYKSKLVTALRWLARVLAAGQVALVLLIAIGEGPPNPINQPGEVQIEFLGMGLILTGLILGWKWEGLGGIMALAGIAIFHAIEGKLWINPFFALFALTGILFLICRILTRGQANKNKTIATT